MQNRLLVTEKVAPLAWPTQQKKKKKSLKYWSTLSVRPFSGASGWAGPRRAKSLSKVGVLDQTKPSGQNSGGFRLLPGPSPLMIEMSSILFDTSHHGWQPEWSLMQIRIILLLSLACHRLGPDPAHGPKAWLQSAQACSELVANKVKWCLECYKIRCELHRLNRLGYGSIYLSQTSIIHSPTSPTRQV